MTLQFGQLRACLQNRTTEQDIIRALLDASYIQNRDQYNDQWKPYLASFPHLRFTTQSFEDLNLLHDLLPEQTPIHFQATKRTTLDGLYIPDNHPAIARITSITTAHVRPKDLDTMLSSLIPNLQSLVMKRSRLNKHHIKPFGVRPPTGNLHTLDIGANQLGGATLAGLWTSPYMEHVKVLGMMQNQLNAQDISHCINWSDTQNLTTLNLAWNNIKVGGCRALGHNDKLNTLRTLNIQSNDISDRGVIALCRSKTLRLEHLNIGNNRLSDEVTTALQDLPNLETLQTLILRVNNISAVGAKALAHTQALSNLHTLNLSTNHIQDEGALAIANSPYLRALKTLDLNHNLITPQGIADMVNALPPTLEHLKLWDNQIGNQGAIAIAQSPNLSNLKTLKISRASMNRRGISALASSAYLPDHIRQTWRSYLLRQT